MNDRLLTTQQAAEILQITTVALRRMAKRGDVRAYKITDAPQSHYRILASDLLAMLRPV